QAVTYATKHGLPVMYVTEDTTRAKPEAVKALYGAAISCGATRICLADTVGHATPDGVKALVRFVREEIVAGKDVKVDWHGHRDRGMGLINCLAAIEAGVDRVHATGLGVIEREVLARDARLRRRARGGVPGDVRGGEAHRSGLVGRRVPPPAQARRMAVGAFRAVERSYFDLRWHLDPVAATQAGVPGYDDRYGRYSPDALRPSLAALKSLAAALEEATTDQLDDEIDRTALLNEARVTLRRFESERPQARNPAFWLQHLLAGLHVLLCRHDRAPEEQARALVRRLEDVPPFLDDARATLVEPVRVFVETALRINEGGLLLV